jgi:hypothetical protein
MECGFGRTESHSPTSIVYVVHALDGFVPLLLLVIWASPNFFRSCPISASSFYSLSLWCVAWSNSSTRQSWTILEIISPSSSMIVYFGGDRCAFDFLRAPIFLYHWSLSSPCFLCDGVHRSFLCSLSMVLLFIGWMSGVCSPLLGPWLLWVALCPSWLDLARSWFLRYWDLWKLCFRQRSPSFCCLSHHCSGYGWDIPFI